MDYSFKIRQAIYFYDRVLSEFENEEHFTYNLSAFLASARSVLQYACEEVEYKRKVEGKKDGKQWYDKYIKNSDVLEFFREERNSDIHVRPVKPTIEKTELPALTTYTSADIEVVYRDASGNVTKKSPLTIPNPNPFAADVPIEYRFAEWPAGEDLVTLCEKYLDELIRFVKDGKSKSFLPG